MSRVVGSNWIQLSPVDNPGQEIHINMDHVYQMRVIENVNRVKLDRDYVTCLYLNVGSEKQAKIHVTESPWAIIEDLEAFENAKSR